VNHPRTDILSEAADALLAAIVESSDDAIISKDLSGTISSWNKAAERIFGYKASEVIGGPISIIIPPDRGQEELEILRRIAAGQRIKHFETVRLRKDGEPVEVSVTVSPLIKNGKIIGASKVARDITRQKAIERDLERQRAQLELTLKSIGDGVIVSDINSRVTFINPVGEALTGWKVDQACGQPLEVVFNIVNERTRRRVENPANRALREGIIVGLANHTLLIAKDGAHYAIEDSAAPIRDKAGDAFGVVLVFRDASGARAAEDFRARLAAIVQSSDDAIVGKDLTGRITSWNPGAARLFGYSAEEAIGRPITMLIPPERLTEESDILERLRRGERVEHFETVRLTKDRRSVRVSLTISPIRDAEGTIVGASKIARDITEQTRTARELAEARESLKKYSEELEKTVAERTAELKAAYRELEAFAYTVAHDLQSPLRRIGGLLTILKQDLGSELEGRNGEVLHKIIRGVDRMDALVRDLLKLSKVGAHLLRREDVNLGALLEQVIAELKPHTQGRQVEWQIGPLPVVRCDAGLMRQVFVNLLSNALKYTRPRPTAIIDIGQTTVDSRLAFYVSDNGVGFDMKLAEKIFTPFHRFHTDPQFEGSGIGLATVDRIIRRHGGQIWAEAEPDRGARFYFTVPDDLTPALPEPGKI
jgi:PAS domain S-box-containing protein